MIHRTVGALSYDYVDSIKGFATSILLQQLLLLLLLLLRELQLQLHLQQQLQLVLYITTTTTAADTTSTMTTTIIDLRAHGIVSISGIICSIHICLCLMEWVAQIAFALLFFISCRQSFFLRIYHNCSTIYTVLFLQQILQHQSTVYSISRPVCRDLLIVLSGECLLYICSD